MLKFVPNKVNGKIVDYSKELNNIKLSLQFDSMDSGINVSYAYKEGKQPAPVAGATPVKESTEDKYLFNRTKVANIINTVIESVTFDDTEFKHVTESTVEKYLTEELMNTDSLMHEYAEALLEYVHPTDESVSNDGYELLEKFKPAYEKVIGDRYACFVVLNESDMLKEFEEASEEDIDEDIKPIIELLNRLGYKTKYSCSGHDQTRITPDHKKDGVYQGKLYTTARITFDKKYNFKVIPKGWYQNPNSDKTSIYVEPLTYNPKNGSPDEAFKKWKEGYMNSLKAWVEDLEESKKTNSSDMVESFMEYAYSIVTNVLESASTNKWAAEPLKSVNGINFGDSRDSVRQKMEKEFSEFNKSKLRNGTTDDFGSCHVYYDKLNKVEAVEVFDDVSVTIKGKKVFPGGISNLKSIASDLEQSGNSYISKELSIGVEMDGDTSKSILFGVKDYYN